MIRKKNYYLAFILSLYSIYGIIDTAMLSLIYNVFMLGIFAALVNFHRESACRKKQIKLKQNINNIA